MTDTQALIPTRDKIRILFAHGAYDMKPIFAGISPDIETMQVATYADLQDKLPEADVLVVSGLWKNDLLPHATRLKYLQSVSSGTNQYDLVAFQDQGILLASGQGVNKNAVSDHAMALMLALTRRIASARDNQSATHWRPEQRNPADREDETPGKTMVVVGTGHIGDRIAKLAKAFDMHVIGVRRDTAKGAGAADEVFPFTALRDIAPRADVLVLSCPLTDETRGLVSADVLAAMKPTAHLINVARGPVVDEDALIAALQAGRLAGAGLDVTTVEPLPADSPLWAMPNVVLTPHSAGETQVYERNVLEILTRNLETLWAGSSALHNRIV
ncbi:D-3-phosphoglycerate dehydrogenase (plasmid) [Ketogulonicigenium robustum]|uniref:D-3-phosphoglycerate dehydrogenase n=1 Tax=Ketogulonicigenium robustum TaxID=92947 RepID=A0A1W6P334_9RHOB|nr:D-2-hydroxyacid dehydrogenase [Ketogulonicigenium robustum]ARO15912.1 D-3-phosphoglycerate dehydrogenase [Ketogulonicigenium robustum]